MFWSRKMNLYSKSRRRPQRERVSRRTLSFESLDRRELMDGAGLPLTPIDPPATEILRITSEADVRSLLGLNSAAQVAFPGGSQTETGHETQPELPPVEETTRQQHPTYLPKEELERQMGITSAGDTAGAATNHANPPPPVPSPGIPESDPLDLPDPLAGIPAPPLPPRFTPQDPSNGIQPPIDDGDGLPATIILLEPPSDSLVYGLGVEAGAGAVLWGGTVAVDFVHEPFGGFDSWGIVFSGSFIYGPQFHLGPSFGPTLSSADSIDELSGVAVGGTAEGGVGITGGVDVQVTLDSETGEVSGAQGTVRGGPGVGLATGVKTTGSHAVRVPEPVVALASPGGWLFMRNIDFAVWAYGKLTD